MRLDGIYMLHYILLGLLAPVGGTMASFRSRSFQKAVRTDSLINAVVVQQLKVIFPVELIGIHRPAGRAHPIRQVMLLNAMGPARLAVNFEL